MAKHLTKTQRAGTALFLALCLLCLFCSVWRAGKHAPAPDDARIEAELRKQLDEIHFSTGSATDTPRHYRRKEVGKKPKGVHPKKREEAEPTPRSPLDEVVSQGAE